MMDFTVVTLNDITVEDTIILCAAFFSMVKGWDMGYKIFRMKL